MARRVSEEIVQGFLEEAQGYLPEIRASIQSWAAGRDPAECFEPAYRLTHTIKGASSMLGLSALSHVAFHEEEVLEELMSGQLAVSGQALEFVTGATGAMESLLAETKSQGGDFEPGLLADVMRSYRCLRGLPDVKDSTALQSLASQPSGAEDPKRLAELASQQLEQFLNLNLRKQASPQAPGQPKDEAQTSVPSPAAPPPEMAPDPSDDDTLLLLQPDDEEPTEWPSPPADVAPALPAAEDSQIPDEPLVPLDVEQGLQAEIHTDSPSHPAQLAHVDTGSPAAEVPQLPVEQPVLPLAEHSSPEDETRTDSPSEADAQTAWKWQFLAAPPADIEPDAAVAENQTQLAEPPFATSVAPWEAGFEPALETAPLDLGFDSQRSSAAPRENFPGLDEREHVTPELLGVYSEEAEDHLRSIHTLLPSLAKRPDDQALVQEIRRVVHTLKGAAGAVGLRTVSQLSHRMEDLLDRLYDGQLTITSEMIELLFGSGDALQDLSEGRFDREAIQATLADLYRRYADVLGESPAPPAAATASEESYLPHAGVKSFGAGIAAAASMPGPAADDVIDLPGLEIPDAPIYMPAAAQIASAAAAPRKSGEVLRVPIERLDELVNLVSELVINRTAFEQRMTEFGQTVAELKLSIERLRQTSSNLDTQYEASSLAGGPLARLTGPGFQAPGFQVPGLPGNRFAGRFDLQEFDALEFDRYTQFHLISRSLAETTNDLNTVGGEFNNLIGDFDSLLNRQGRLTRDIQGRLMQVRMVPLATLATRLHRTVRVVAGPQEKLVDLVLEGEHIELDKTVLEEMVDPLLHLLRNAVDHGVEPPQLRQVKGKPERATIRIRAFHQGTQVVIQVSDDGNGLDPETLRSVAVRGGHVPQAAAQNLSNHDLWQLIFLPGFTTASTLTEVSGRGVGMDTVRTKVHKLKGTVTVDSTPGQGASFTIRLPMTLAITRALLVKVNTETFAIPMQAVTQILRIEREKIERVGQSPVLRVGGKIYPLMRLGEALRLKSPVDESSPVMPVLFVNTDDQLVAVAVDKILSGREIVVKTLGNHLRRVHGLMGATLLGDGTVVPILNPSEMLRSAPRTETRPRSVARAAETEVAALNLMIVDDSVSVRRVVGNLITNAGWNATSAKDGMEALEILHRMPQPPDLILLDVEMPRMDGYELLATLRSQEAYRRLPVVMVTSRAGDKHRKKALELGATDYVVKPFEDGALLDLIRKLVRNARESVLV